MTNLGFVEYFDSIKLVIAKMLTQNDTTEWSGTKCTQTLEIFKATGILCAHIHYIYKQQCTILSLSSTRAKTTYTITQKEKTAIYFHNEL